MKSVGTLFVLVCFFGFFGNESHAELWKCVDKDGVIYFKPWKVPNANCISSQELQELRLEQQRPATDHPIQGKPISIDLESHQVPRSYRGDDIIDSLKRIKKLLPFKTEYETTESYNRRIQNSGLMDTIFAFQVNALIPDLYQKRYNADKRSMIVDLPTRTLASLQSSSCSVTIKTIDKRPTYSTESNAFGVSVQVTSRTGVRYEVVPVNTGGTSYSFLVKDLPPDIAQAIKEESKTLVICKPKVKESSGELIWSHSDYSKPTLDAPVRYNYDVNYLSVELLEIWLYSPTSGMVYHKHRI